MGKKGQVTVFIVIGLLVVFALGIILFTSYFSELNQLRSESDQRLLDAKAEQISYFIRECLYDYGKKGIFLMGEQGGYIDPEKSKIPFELSGYTKIPYWYHDGKDISPSLKDIEKELSFFVQSRMLNCTNFDNFSSLEGTIITKGEQSLNVSIVEKKVIFSYTFPIILKKDKLQKELSYFEEEVPLPIYDSISTAKNIINSIETNGLDSPDFCIKNRATPYQHVFPYPNKIRIIDYRAYSDFKVSFFFNFAYSSQNKLYQYCN